VFVSKLLPSPPSTAAESTAIRQVACVIRDRERAMAYSEGAATPCGKLTALPNGNDTTLRNSTLTTRCLETDFNCFLCIPTTILT
jgi:hypothetical protein